MKKELKNLVIDLKLQAIHVLLPSQWTGIKEKDDRKWGKEMGKENVIFHYLAGVQRDKKEKGKDGAFLLVSIIYSFLSKLRKKHERKW